MVLDDPVTATGAAAIVFFLFLGALYLMDPRIPGKVWFGIVFVLIGVVILLLLVGQAGLGVIVVGIIAAFVAKGQLERAGIVK